MVFVLVNVLCSEFRVQSSEFRVQSSEFRVLRSKKNPDQSVGIFLIIINLRLFCFLRKLSRVLFERQLELERILRIPL